MLLLLLLFIYFFWARNTNWSWNLVKNMSWKSIFWALSKVYFVGNVCNALILTLLLSVSFDGEFILQRKSHDFPITSWKEDAIFSKTRISNIFILSDSIAICKHKYMYNIYNIIIYTRNFLHKNLSTCTRTQYFAHYGIDSGSTGEIHYVKYLVSYTFNIFNTYNTFNIILSFTKISFLCNVIFLSTANVHNTRQCLDILLQPIRLKLAEPPQNAVIVHITQPQTITFWKHSLSFLHFMYESNIYLSV